MTHKEREALDQLEDVFVDALSYVDQANWKGRSAHARRVVRINMGHFRAGRLGQLGWFDEEPEQ